MTKARFNNIAHIWVQWGKTAFISHIITTCSPAYLRNSSTKHNHFPPIISYWFSPSAKRQSEKRSYNQRRWYWRGHKEWGGTAQFCGCDGRHACKDFNSHFTFLCIQFSDSNLTLWELEFHLLTWVLCPQEFKGRLLDWEFHHYHHHHVIINIHTNITTIAHYFLQWMIIITNAYFHHQGALSCIVKVPRGICLNTKKRQNQFSFNIWRDLTHTVFIKCQALSAIHILIHIILIATPWGRYFNYYLHLTSEKLKHEKAQGAI